MKAILVKENLNENLGQGLFGVYEMDPDYVNINFYADLESAQKEFDSNEGGILFQLTGPGNLYSGRDSQGTGGVQILDEKYPDW
jgi:hypothetical protein